MKNNKGFIGLGLILAIIAVLVVGGGAYYLGTKNDSVPKNVVEENNLPQENQNNVINNNTVTENKIICNSNSPSTIQVLSPNGGEIYQAGGKITVKWKSCNVTPGSIGITLIKRNSLTPYKQEMVVDDYAGFNLGGFDPYKGTVDDGIEQLTLPTFSEDNNLTLGQYYFISVNGTGDATHIGSGYGPGDYSDNLFTIK